MLTWCEINLAHIRHNVRTLRRVLGSGPELIAVVKANAYGHGLIEVARTCQAEGVRWFGVAEVAEAVVLQEALDPPCQLLLLGYAEAEELAEAVRRRVHLGVFDEAYAEQVDQVAAAVGQSARVHLKIDTGLSRQGVLAAEGLPFVRACFNLPHLEVAGLWTHFACADSGHPEDVAQPLARFLTLRDALRAQGWPVPFLHAANSAATLFYPPAHLDGVRCGLALYGLWPNPALAPRLEAQAIVLFPALSWKSKLVQVKTVPAGSSVSYGASFTTTRPTRLGVVGVGYGDGYDRGLSNVGEILVRGVRCPIRGRVCMKHVVVDLTDLPAEITPRAGEEVTLLGPAGGDCITADELAAHLDTINYEITTRLPPTLPRVFDDPPAN